MTPQEVLKLLSSNGEIISSLGGLIKLCLVAPRTLVYLAYVEVPGNADQGVKELSLLARRIFTAGYSLVDGKLVIGVGEPISLEGKNRIVVSYALELAMKTHCLMKEEGVI